MEGMNQEQLVLKTRDKMDTVQINQFKLIFSTFITIQEKTINSQHTVDVWRFS